jgi:hypothetical protein
MISNNLIDEILVKPCRDGADKLCIVSGYASPSMVYRHFSLIPKNIKVNLIVGMCLSDGMDKGSHSSFKNLVSKDYRGRFSCRYLITPPPVHTKNYTWVKNGDPFASFTGSANFSQRAFFQKTREGLAIDDPVSGFQYYNDLISQSLNCTDRNIENKIYFYESPKREVSRKTKLSEKKYEDLVEGLERVDLELLDKKGSLISRLNWGHRGSINRNLDEAYIHIPAKIDRLNFFPERNAYFNIITDDGEGFVFKRGGDNGKNLSTPINNSILGAYFRKRLKLSSGTLVTHSDLINYGRKNVTFYKLDDDNYFLDFSKPK